MDPSTTTNGLRLWIGVAFLAALVVFMMAAYWQRAVSAAQSQILRLLAALAAGMAAATFSGEVAIRVAGQVSAAANWSLAATAGMALFVLVWLTWKRAFNAPGFNVSFPAGCGFGEAAALIGAAAATHVTLHGFTPAEQAAVLTAQELHGASVADALANLATLLPAGAVRRYSVSGGASGYLLRA
jgi:hypothetical protein